MTRPDRSLPTHARMFVTTLLCASMLACGGGEGGSGADAVARAAPQVDTTVTPGATLPAAAVALAGTKSADGRLPPWLPEVLAGDGSGAGEGSGAAGDGGSTTAPETAASAPVASVDGQGDALQPPAALASAATLQRLSDAPGDAKAGLRAVAATATCREGFVAPADLQRSRAADLPASGGVFFTAQELTTWRERVVRGPFVDDSDFAPGSPGDWSRIRANAERFQREGEALRGSDEATRSTHGLLARDAAFHHLMTGQAASLAAVRAWLQTQATAAANDFAATRCYSAQDGSSRDGWWAEAPWLARFIATYDFVRAALPAAERVTIENYIRRNAWFFAAHLDHQLRELFPQRLAGDYAARGGDAASSGDARWAARRVDANGDCRIDDADPAQPFPVHAYARADGTLGPRVSVLALWFNNRRAANAFAAGSAGLLLGDADLVNRAKRYFMEWMTYAVYPDGSTGEFGRNGEYCIARQGTVYASMELGGALMLARALARQGDPSLAAFSTTAGLHGSESAGAAAKSLTLLADTYLKLHTGQLDWYQAEPQKARQDPREATRLSRMEVRYLGGAPMDDFHELTMLASAAAVPTLPVGAVLMRQGAAASLRWPGRTGHPVATGFGLWSDAWGILPAAYLLRP